MILSVQCKRGNVGEKPVTVLSYKTAGVFHGLINTGSYQYGINDGGIWQLNYAGDGEAPTDDGQEINYSVRFNASDFGVTGNLKKIMHVYSMMSSAADCSTAPMVSLKADEQQEFFASRNLINQKMIRTAAKCQCKGTYWTIGLDSNVPFTLLAVTVNFIVLPMGISNG